MFRRSLWLLLLSLLPIALLPIAQSPAAEKPRLIVALSVDQMAQDYLIRFADNFDGSGAFRRVEKEGARFAQCHHRHAFTVTAPGHAVQLTGAYPAVHGIIGNNWFDRFSGKDVFCCDDPSTTIIGLPMAKGVSPKNMQVETVGDLLRLATANRSKVFGVAFKERAAILMTGHDANAAYWLDDNLWVTSSYYRSDLPGYLRLLNEQQAIERYRGKTWGLMLAKEKYHNTGPDKNPWENPPKGFTSEFPHQLAAKGTLTPLEYGEHVLFSPYGIEYTLEAARAIIEGEQLGQDEFPDMLCINFSTNDYLGHAFGPHSLEVEDITYQTDRQLGDFLRYLDQQVGAGKWTFALTADHGVAPIAEYARQFKLPAARNPLGDLKQVKAKLEARLREKLSVAAGDPPLIQKVEEIQVYLQHDHPAFLKPGGDDRFALAQRLIRDWLLDQPAVALAMTRDELLAGAGGKVQEQLQRHFHPRRSGDVLWVLKPFNLPGTKGTTHGSPWHYDTHVPMLLVGAGIAPGKFDRLVGPACLASTVAELLGVDWPSGNAEEPLREALLK